MSTTKVALITGANKGLGMETARHLSNLNIRCIVPARSEQKLNYVKYQFEQEGNDADYFKLDVTQQNDIYEIKNYRIRSYVWIISRLGR